MFTKKKVVEQLENVKYWRELAGGMDEPHPTFLHEVMEEIEEL